MGASGDQHMCWHPGGLEGLLWRLPWDRFVLFPLFFSLFFFFFLFFKLGAAALLSAHTTAFNELALLIFVRCLLSIFNVQWCIAIVREGSLSTTPLERETS